MSNNILSARAKKLFGKMNDPAKAKKLRGRYNKLKSKNEKRLFLSGLGIAQAKKKFKEAQRQAKKEFTEAQRKADIDGLTGILNRRGLEKKAKELWKEFEHTEYKRRKEDKKEDENLIGIIFFDLDHFKKVNDTYGHQAGDHVLKEAVKTTQETMRMPYTLGRYGGEEFLVLIKVNTDEEITKIAERLREAIKENAFSFNKKEIPNVTISLGVTAIDPIKEDSTLEDSIATADNALYEAKNSGRNRVIFERKESAEKEKRPLQIEVNPISVHVPSSGSTGLPSRQELHL